MNTRSLPSPRRLLQTAALALGIFVLVPEVRAQAIPILLNYQGRVAVDTVNFEGAGLFKFALVNPAGDLTFWSNDGTSTIGDEPAAAVSLSVAKGLYSVLLGDTALVNMLGINPAVFANPDVRLRVWFDDGVNASQLLTPDQRLAPAAYLADGAVTSASIADAAIVAAKIAPAAIDGTHVAAGALDFSHLFAPAAPGAGQVLSFDGASLNWVNAGVSDGIWALNGTTAFYNGGYVGIGTSTPAHFLSIAGAQPAWTSYSWGGAIELTNGSAIAWRSNLGGQRFGIGQTNGGLHFFRTASDPGTTASVPIYDMYINDVGNVVMTGGSPGLFTVGAPNGETGHSLRRDGNRADVRFDGDSLKLVAGVGTGPPLAASGLEISTSGNVVMTGGGPGIVTFGAPNGESGCSIQRGGSRADLRFDGTSIKLVAGPGIGPPGSLNGMIVKTDGNVGIGTTSPVAKLHVVGTTRTSVLTITGGADIAEPFPMKEDGLEKGSVVVIDAEHPGRLKRSISAYDRRVAGIVSGANGINAGISLRQEGVMDGGQNVALSGRVYVQADASGGAIQPGDMLTTSDTPGHAMKVGDHTRSQGAVIGKAMSALPEGRGLVLVLVTLQ